MTHRQRVMTAFAHQQPDCVPIDFGGTRVSSIVVEGYQRLQTHFGVRSPIVQCDRMMRVVEIDERILRRLDTDTRAMNMPSLVRTPTVELPNGYRDGWGIERFCDPGSYYCDQKAYPLAGDISLADIDRYPWPYADDPGVTVGLRDRLRDIRQNTDCAAVLSLSAPFVHASQYLRGFEDWYMDFLLNPSLLEALFDRVLDLNMAWARRQLLEVGNDIDIVICSDDLGTQNGLQVNRELYLKFIKPRHEKFFRQVHELTSAKLALHCCGSIVSIIDDLIDIGVQGLNPVQTSAAGMVPSELKKKYRGRMLFWGAMDTQSVLPHGSVSDVKRMVEQRVEELGEGGGYIVAPCHNIQPDVPVENIMAMYEHAREYVPSYMK